MILSNDHKGKTLIKTKRFDEALKSFQIALQLEPKNADCIKIICEFKKEHCNYTF